MTEFIITFYNHHRGYLRNIRYCVVCVVLWLAFFHLTKHLGALSISMHTELHCSVQVSHDISLERYAMVCLAIFCLVGIKVYFSFFAESKGLSKDKGAFLTGPQSTKKLLNI